MNTPASTPGFRRVPAILAVLASGAVSPPGGVVRAADGSDELTEPIFTERSFIEKNVELDTVYEGADDGDDLELSVEANWVFFERLQLGVEVPFDISFPDAGGTDAAFGDVGLSTQYLLCCQSDEWLDYLSLRAEVAPPTGDRDKDIGGDGSFGFSALAGALLPVVEGLPDLGIQTQVGYEQQIRLTDDQLETARDLDLSKTREKDVIWNLAFSQNYADWRLQPVFEVLGTTTVDALQSDDEGTIVELGGGFWWTPFADGQGVKNLDIAVGAKGPVTGRKDSDVTVVMYFDWSL